MKKLSDDHICSIYTVVKEAEENKKKIIIYGTDEYSCEANIVLSLLDIDILCFVDETKKATMYGKEVHSIVDVLYEDSIEDILLLIVKPETDIEFRIRPMLVELGIPSNIIRTVYTESCGDNFHFQPDQLLVTNVNLDIMGFTIFNNSPETKGTKIVTLGGSTTFSIFNKIMSWSEFLYERLKEEGYQATVLCGGIPCYNSTQELYKLIRDIIPMRPDIVISYSGYNDLYVAAVPSLLTDNSMLQKRPYLNAITFDSFEYIKKEKNNIFWGLQNENSLAEQWIENMRAMYWLCKGVGIKFLAFLQPFLILYDDKSKLNELYCSSMTFENAKFPVESHRFPEMRKNYQEFIQLIKDGKYDYIVDATDLFEGESNIYYDLCHVYEKGNHCISNRIFAEIVKRGYLDC